jgi:hypothetical protein
LKGPGRLSHLLASDPVFILLAFDCWYNVE